MPRAAHRAPGRHQEQPRSCQGLTVLPVPHGAGRWQEAVSGSCCPRGQLAPVPQCHQVALQEEASGIFCRVVSLTWIQPRPL